MIYEGETTTREKLLELRRTNVCTVCRGKLDVFLDVDRGKAYLACRADQAHEGIERTYEQKPFEKEGYGAFNIETRREMMNEQLGEKATLALTKANVPLSGKLTQLQAQTIITTVWKGAPALEVYKASMLCQDYGLHPLMKHIYLVKYNRYNKQRQIVGEDWSILLGIGATRLIAHRDHAFSYMDDSPRHMTEEEGQRILGDEYQPDKYIYAITRLKDQKSGAEVSGVGSWDKAVMPKGADKGNTRLNMACIRSERKAIDRQYPGEMPKGYDVYDEQFVEVGEGVIEGEIVRVKEDDTPPPSQTEPEGVAEKGDSAEPGGEEEPAGSGAGETISATTKGKENQKNRSAPAAARTSEQITPDDLPDGFALERVANEVWGLQPNQVWDEVNYPSVRHFEEAGVESAWDCFLKIKAARG